MKRLEQHMSNHITSEELSAFVDGEARNASKIRLHIEHCEVCTAKIEAHKSLRESLKTLGTPDVHPAFATRVRATIEERAHEPEPVSISAYRWVFSLSSIAAITLLTVSVVSNRTAPVGDSVTDSNLAVASAQEAAWKSILEQDETDIATKLEISLAREWIDSAIALAPYEVAEPKTADDETAVLSVALSGAQPEELRTDLLVKNADVMTEITRMSPSQSELFKQMLVMHAREEILGDNAFEG